jgi:hypothetical protein
MNLLSKFKLASLGCVCGLLKLSARQRDRDSHKLRRLQAGRVAVARLFQAFVFDPEDLEVGFSEFSTGKLERLPRNQPSPITP